MFVYWGRTKARVKRSQVLMLAALLLFPRCEHNLNKFSAIQAQLGVAYNPYAAVDWGTWETCLSQHHDHVGLWHNPDILERRIRDYDEAGYQAVGLLYYSGVRSKAFASSERIWPLSRFLTQYSSDNAFLSTTKSLRLFFPTMEEVGRDHMTSPFLNTFIALWEPDFYDEIRSWHYGSSQECIETIQRFNGMAIIAHPTKPSSHYLDMDGIDGIEIYNAFYRFQHEVRERSEDENHHFVTVWDDLLTHKASRIFGYAVNDWFGPFDKVVQETHPQVYDSGKTMVLVKEFTLESYRASLERGAFFAITDFGITKGGYPRIERIEVNEQFIEIRADGTVKWIFNSETVQEGPIFRLGSRPSNLNYIRAEVSNENGAVYIQPFSLEIAALEDGF